MQQFDRVAGDFHYKTRTGTLAFLTQFYNETQQNEKGLPVATFDSIIKYEAPVVLSGIPGSGKSFELDAFLKDCRKRSILFLLFNSDNRDHAWLANWLQGTGIVALRWLDNPGQTCQHLQTPVQEDARQKPVPETRRIEAQRFSVFCA